jgi:hypothetical protein
VQANSEAEAAIEKAITVKFAVNRAIQSQQGGRRKG